MTSKEHTGKIFQTIKALRRCNSITDKLIESESLKNGIAEDLIKMVLYGRKRKKEPEAIPGTTDKVSPQRTKTKKTEKVKDKAVKIKRMSYKELLSQPLYNLKHN